MSCGSTAWPNSQRLPLAGRQQAGQHLHGRGLAAAVGAEEAEDLAALDAEAHVVDGDEIAEAHRQIPRLDGDLAVVRRARGGISTAR